MRTQLNEVQRLQKIAGLLTETDNSGDLSHNEQELVDAVLGDSIEEGINLDDVLKKVKLLSSKGLLTLAMASTILASCGTAGSADEMFRREVENAKKVQNIEHVQQAKIDSITNAMNSGTAVKINELKKSKSNESYDLGPVIDLSKLKEVLNAIVDKDGEQIIDREDKKSILIAIKKMPKLIKQLQKQDDWGDAPETLENLSWDWITQLPKDKQRVFKTLEDGIIALNTAGNEMDPSYAVKGYKTIYDFVNSY